MNDNQLMVLGFLVCEASVSQGGIIQVVSSLATFEPENKVLEAYSKLTKLEEMQVIKALAEHLINQEKLKGRVAKWWKKKIC